MTANSPFCGSSPSEEINRFIFFSCTRLNVRPFWTRQWNVKCLLVLRYSTTNGCGCPQLLWVTLSEKDFRQNLSVTQVAWDFSSLSGSFSTNTMQLTVDAILHIYIIPVKWAQVLYSFTPHASADVNNSHLLLLKTSCWMSYNLPWRATPTPHPPVCAYFTAAVNILSVHFIETEKSLSKTFVFRSLLRT